MATAAAIDVLLRANVAQYRASMIEAGRITNTQLGAIRKQTEATSRSVQTFNRALGGFIGIQSLISVSKQLSNVADGFSNVQAKIRLAAGENANMAASFDRVFGIAQRTYNTLDGTAALVQRGAQALQSFGQNTEAAFNNSAQLAEIFNKSLVISGASASEAASAALQFSQALASGRFQGDEFRSVMENNSRFARLLADSLGVNIAQLRDLSREGKLTTQSFLDLLSQAKEIDAEFARMPLTIGRAKTQLDNAFTKFVGEADQARGASRAIAASLSALANNLGPVIGALGQLAIVAGGAFGARALQSAKAYAASMLQQAAASRAAEEATKQKALADRQAAQATLLKARNEQIAAEQVASAAAVDRARIQSVIATAKAQEAAIRANALRATSEVELARLSRQLTAVENARAAATLALGEARQAEVRANAQLLVSNRALQASYAATGVTGAAAATKITVGMRAAAIAQGAMTIATRAFSGALALVGGPLGVLIIGVGLLANAFANAKVKADQAAASFKSAIEQANNFLDNQSRASALQAASSLIAERARVQSDLARRRELRSNAGVAYFDEGVFRTGGGLDDQIRKDQAAVDELTRKLNLVNAQIMQNRESWSEAAGTGGEAAATFEKQNAALDKQLQNLTAQRLELTKGYRARLEYEAMQEQGVKTALDLDAGTRSRIDALVKEHAAVQAATAAKKGGAKADRDAIAAGKARETQLTSIIDRINRQIALDRESMLVTDDMTAAQKLQVIITEELKSAKNKLSDAEKARVKVLLDEAVAQGTAAKAMEDAKRGAEDLLRLQNQLNESLRTQQMDNAADLFSIGHGSDVTEQMRRRVEIQREYQRQVESLNLQLAAAGGDKATDAAKQAYQNQLDALDSYHKAALAAEGAYQEQRAEMMADWTNGYQKALDDFIAYADDIAGRSAEFYSGIFGQASSGFADFITGAKSAKEAFGDFADYLFQQSAKFVADQVLSGILKKFGGGASSDDAANDFMGAASALAASAAPLSAAAAALSASAAALAAAGLGGSASNNYGEAVGSLLDLFSGSGFGFKDGGPTPPGPRHKAVGVVHAGEVVWSQPDIARAGGVAVVEAMRRGIRGYADGGFVGGSLRVAVSRRSDESEVPATVGRRSGRGDRFEFHLHNPQMTNIATDSQRLREEARKMQLQTARA